MNYELTNFNFTLDLFCNVITLTDWYLWTDGFSSNSTVKVTVKKDYNTCFYINSDQKSSRRNSTEGNIFFMCLYVRGL